MKKLPVGISTFAKIRKGDYCYADKTGFIRKLVDSGAYFFISRPRRFGKSLFIDTLREAFSCNKKLFKGLALEKTWNWERPYPVIHISFGGGVVKTRAELDSNTLFQLRALAKQETLETTDDRTNLLFRELILALHKKYDEKVVILIDEYDKPILDNITNHEVAREVREGLKNFYTVIKDSDAYVQFCLLTGVSKFSKVSLFSGLNNLEDLTLNREFATLCGYTQNDLETVFAEHLQDLDLKKIKQWYNGYSFLGDPVYNPFDVLLLLKNREFKNYWFETGTPTFLIDLLREKQFFMPDLENLRASEAILSTFDVDDISPEALLFQTGYLTIKGLVQVGAQRTYDLTYPNLEVRSSLTDHLLESFAKNTQQKRRNLDRLYALLQEGKVQALEALFTSFFASIPYDWYRKNQLAGYEGYYASIFYTYFSALGLDLIAEDITNQGRIDLTVKVPGFIYLFEFKVKGHCGDDNHALKQLVSKRYHEKYSGSGNQIFLIGIEFDPETRNITSFDWQNTPVGQ